MTLTDRLTGKGAHDNLGKTGDSNTQAAPAFETGSNTNDYETTGRKKGLGEKIKEKIGLDPKDANDPRDQGTSYEGAHSTGVGSSSSTGTTGNSYNNQSSEYSTTGTTGSSSTYGGSSVSDSNQSSGTDAVRRDSSEHFPVGKQHHSDKYETREAAPIVAEHVHDEYTEIDRTREEELHDRTKVKQTVQPVRDEQTEGLQRDRVDHGLEVHEHGKAGLDERTRAEMAAKREALGREHSSTHDERTVETTSRPDVDVQERTNKVEEVVPVVEKDIYRPHETEHHKRVVNIHHERPELAGQSTNAPISLKEWESQGHSVGSTSTTTSRGIGGRTRTGSSSSSSSDNEGTGRTGTTHRKKGLGEKVKEAVGLDPKDGQDPKDAAYNNQSTGYNNQGTGVGSSGVGSTGSTFGGDRTGTGGQQGYGQTESTNPENFGSR